MPPGAGFAFTAPDALAASLPPRTTSAVELVLHGSGFTPEYSQRVAVDGGTAVFSPDWDAAAPDQSGIAYALYRLNVGDFRGVYNLYLPFIDGPPTDSNLWIGTPNWTAGRWEWWQVYQGFYLELFLEDCLNSINPATGDLPIFVVVTGHQQVTLNAVRVDPRLPNTVTGYTVLESGAGLEGVTVSFADELPPVTSSWDGYWVRDDVPLGEYTATPSLAGYNFMPTSRMVEIAPDVIYAGEHMFHFAWRLFGTTGWAHTWEQESADSNSVHEILKLASDASGNVYAAGVANLADGPDYAQCALLKFDSAGTLQWARTWGGADYDGANDVSVDTDGNAYVVGTDWGSGPLPYRGYISKYSPAGQLLWQRAWQGPAGSGLTAVHCTEQSIIYAAGFAAPSASDPCSDGLLLAFDANGVLAWQRLWGGNRNERWYDIGLGESGLIYVCGETLSYGAGARDIALAAYYPDGGLAWQKCYGTVATESGAALQISPAGELYIGGFSSTLPDDEAGQWGDATADGLLLKCNAAGGLLWARAWGGDSTDMVWDLALSPGGVIYAAGQNDEMGLPRGCLLKYSADGTLLDQQSCSSLNYINEDTLVFFGIDINTAGRVALGGLAFHREYSWHNTDCELEVPQLGSLSASGISQPGSGVFQELTLGQGTAPGVIDPPGAGNYSALAMTYQ